ncbi:hypothetical protein QCA50_004729 [Cerrena zonata]|uniref:DNA-directed DNA polymerase X domain-containing protein n=1 Tax=Cerrena zonata TaxID=2478898 RepID=A0AAW0GDE7_9APHY
MPFKRPAPLEASSSNLSSPSDSHLEDIEGPSKRSKISLPTKVLPDIKLYVIQAKLSSPRIAELFTLAEKHCQKLCNDIDEADVVVTAISMRRRLERHMSWEVATTKAVVTPEWTLPCDCEETDYGSTQSPVAYPSSSASAASGSPRQRKASHGKIPPLDLSAEIRVEVPSHLLPPRDPVPTNLERLTYTSRYACQRASPLLCPNQELALELDIIRRSRALEGEERSALSYARAISTVKAYPHRIKSVSQVQRLPHLGAKISGLVEEFLDKGQISEARDIMTSERFKTLTDFSSVYGIGPHTARRLFDLGLRTFDDLEVYYGVDPAEVDTELMELEHEENHPGWKGRKAAQQQDDFDESWIKIALGLRADLSKKIPRDEVDEISKVVMHELEIIEPGCVSTIVGGYRRGKPESNDADIVFTHSDGPKVKGLCKRLVRQLHKQGMVSHVMHLSSFHGHNPLRTTHWDSLEKALTVFTLPKSSSLYTGTRRRLDLIFADPNVYWCAVVGWSGSIMFQRDLRQWANDKCGIKFDSSGITRRYDSKPFYPGTEKEVFDLLGLEWVDPTWRNTDV